MEPIITYFIITVFALVGSVLLTNLLHRQKNADLKEGVILFVSILTVFSIFFGIFTYSTSLQIKYENEQIVKKNALLEINANLFTINKINEKLEEYSKGNSFNTRRFSFFFLEQLLEFEEDDILRNNIFVAIDIIKQSDLILGVYDDINRYLILYNVTNPSIEKGQDVNFEVFIETVNVVEEMMLLLNESYSP